MKKLKIRLFVLFAFLCSVFGLGFNPMIANADTIDETSEITSDIVNSTSEKETLEEILVGSYYYEESADKGVMFVVKDEINVECVLFLDGAEVATVNATYVADGDIIDVYAMEDWLGAFRLNADGTATDVSYLYEELPDENNQESAIEPNNQAIIDEELDKYLQPIICAVAGISGTSALVLVFAAFSGVIKKKFKEIVVWWKSKKEELSKEGVELNAIKAEISEAVLSSKEVKEQLEILSKQNHDEYIAFLTAVKEAINAATEMVHTSQEYYEKKAKIRDKQYEQVKEILILIATGNSELVRKGVADEIVKKFDTETLNEKGKE